MIDADKLAYYRERYSSKYYIALGYKSSADGSLEYSMYMLTQWVLEIAREHDMTYDEVFDLLKDAV